MIDVFGEAPIRKIFARTWNLREKGIQEIEAIVKNGSQGLTPNDVFISGIEIVKLTITDKIIGVYQASIQLLTNICFNGTKLRFSQSEA